MSHRIVLISFLLLVPANFISSGYAQPIRKYIISEFEITHAEHLSQEEILRSFVTKQGDTLIEAVLADDLERLISSYADIGFAFANAEIVRLQPIDSGHISIRIEIHEGPASRLSSCHVNGISETDTGVIAREFFISLRPVATKELLSTGVARLRQSGLFASVSDPTLYKINDSLVGVTLDIQETRTTAIDGVLGYNPATNSGSNSYINGFLDFAFLNIGGSARQAALRYERLTESASDLSFRYLEPWIAGVPVDGSISVLRHDEDSLYVATHLECSFALHSLGAITISIGGSYDAVTPGSSQLVDASHIFSGLLSFAFDRRDDPIAPTHGYKILISAIYGAKSVVDSLGYSITAGIRTFNADAEAALPLGSKRFVGSLSFSAHEVDSKALDLSDLFRVGGLQSLRGYSDASFLVSRYAVVRIEPRFMLASRSYIGIFSDIGYLEQAEYLDVPFRSWSAIGYGLSFLFDTQIGYLQAAIAVARGVPLNAAVLHFGIKTAL